MRQQPRKPAGTPVGGQWAPTAHDEADIDLSPVTLCAQQSVLATRPPDSPELFSGADVIHSYFRAQAIEDGGLVDASAMAKGAGFKFPVAITRAAWEDAVAWDDGNGGLQDEDGRLWDVLWMARDAAKRARHGQDRVDFSVLRVPSTPRSRAPKLTGLIMHIGPGDDAEPVITIMKSGED